jgi:hypothetical protein
MKDKFLEWVVSLIEWVRGLESAQKTEAIIALALVVLGAFALLHVYLTTQPDKSIEWRTVVIGNGATSWTASWQDISALRSDVWVCGALEWGGGGGDIGRGILAHSADGGRVWERVDPEKFESGSGSFTWGPTGNRLYRWSDVGPITSIIMYKPTGAAQPEGWITSSSGAYVSKDGGAQWKMSSPGPAHADRYAHMGAIASLEGVSEIYAVGWQGIAHWTSLSNELCRILGDGVGQAAW